MQEVALQHRQLLRKEFRLQPGYGFTQGVLDKIRGVDTDFQP